MILIDDDEGWDCANSNGSSEPSVSVTSISSFEDWEADVPKVGPNQPGYDPETFVQENNVPL